MIRELPFRQGCPSIRVETSLWSHGKTDSFPGQTPNRALWKENRTARSKYGMKRKKKREESEQWENTSSSLYKYQGMKEICDERQATTHVFYVETWKRAYSNDSVRNLENRMYLESREKWTPHMWSLAPVISDTFLPGTIDAHNRMSQLVTMERVSLHSNHAEERLKHRLQITQHTVETEWRQERHIRCWRQKTSNWDDPHSQKTHHQRNTSHPTSKPPAPPTLTTTTMKKHKKQKTTSVQIHITYRCICIKKKRV